jgi:ABC-type phosphate transport system substrate-binding protein
MRVRRFTTPTASPRGIVKEFIDFTLGDAGQKIVEQVGFVPIK